MPSGKSKEGDQSDAQLLETMPAAAEEVANPAANAASVALDETALPPEGGTIRGIGSVSQNNVSELDETALPEDPSTPPPPAQPRAQSEALAVERGDALGRYVVLDLLGKGGMGEVYSAYDPTLDRKVALKVLRPALSTGGSVSTARARLTQEAQAMAKLAHPNVIQVFDVGTVNGDVYVAMEFVDGPSLRDWLKEDHSTEEILALFQSAALGLAAAHDAGLVHRDFKPDNVLIGKDGRVRVIDFGIASLGGGESTNADAIIEELSRTSRKVAGSYSTLTGVAAGTPAYMAPEQFAAQACDARTDQFSFAVALYEALYKERPFEGTKIAELSFNVIEGNRRPIPASSEIPYWVEGAVVQSLAPAPEDRHESMQALLAALTPPQSWLSKSRVLAMIGVVLAAGAVFAFLLLGQDKEPETCHSEESLVAGIWGPGQAKALKEHFAKSPLPYANATAAKAVDHLNQHRESWLSARNSLCLAAVRKDLTEELKLRGMACLDRRLRELDAVGTILSTATDETIKNAPIVVSGLSSIADCTNTTRLTSSDDALPPQWQEVEDQFAELKALFGAGQHKQLLKRATEVQTVAVEREFLRGTGVAINWRGSAERALAMYDEAEEHFFEAIRIGQKVKDPHIRAEGWEGLMSLAGSNGHPKDGLRWHKHAVLANEEAGVDPDLQARLTYIHGFLHYKMQHYEKALGQFQASAALYEKIYGPTHWRVSANLSLASASLRQLARFDEAVATGQRALQVATESLGPDHPRLASIHNGAANTLGRLMRFDEARAHYKEALRLSKLAHGERSASVGMFLNNMALMELRDGKFEDALELATQALELRREFLGDRHAGVVRTRAAIATAHFRLGDLTKALELQSDAVQRYIVIYGDNHRVTARSQANLCNYQRRAKQYSAAEDSCAKALKVLDPDAPDPRDLAQALTYAAWLDLERGKKDRSLSLAERAWGLRQAHTSQPSSEAMTRFVLGLALEAKGRHEEALAHVEHAKITLLAGEPGGRHDLPKIEAFLASAAAP